MKFEAGAPTTFIPQSASPAGRLVVAPKSKSADEPAGPPALTRLNLSGD